ncbi:uncharacterized protein SCODWIG_00552 [Saccharomycodes ludwigii]|uniref:Tyrosyl-DNA phosphodiesterase 1 n=1 Tax=Saccharomycodes ludwigii TaxID=36035 RepID=A0A376B2B2_9ASCO|nr:hypothetical protein SCDLUD_000992 [Saccharomycodes ludwigii]KAH3903363.1 hypothetical protein SCDLUD_000992 [Saccharomycodes ludwigii]SSD58791.1 uncharacterized protein SCODWIG_00552 [Saccharomycodes ludwigii]
MNNINNNNHQQNTSFSYNTDLSNLEVRKRVADHWNTKYGNDIKKSKPCHPSGPEDEKNNSTNNATRKLINNSTQLEIIETNNIENNKTNNLNTNKIVIDLTEEDTNTKRKKRKKRKENINDLTLLEENSKQHTPVSILKYTVTNNNIDKTQTQKSDTRNLPSMYLLRSIYYDRSISFSKYIIDMHDIFLAYENNNNSFTLDELWLFSYQYELDYIFPYIDSMIGNAVCINKTSNKPLIKIVYQKGTFLLPSNIDLKIKYEKYLRENIIQLLEIQMKPYTSHHSKMIIQKWKSNNGGSNDFLKIYIPSANFTFSESNLPRQMCWYSGKLPIYSKTFDTGDIETNTPAPSNFKKHLLDYIESYANASFFKSLITLLKTPNRVDFSSLKNYDFLYSTVNPKYLSGYRLMNTLLNRHNYNGDAVEKELIVQVSSIGAPLKKKSYNRNLYLLDDILVPLYSSEKLNDDPLVENGFLSNSKFKGKLIYPSVTDFLKAPMGYYSSGWFHFHYSRSAISKSMYSNWIKEKSLFKFNDSKKRSLKCGYTPSHTKFYYLRPSKDNCKNEENNDKMYWCLFTSCNLSGTAWGTYSGLPRNYEVGVIQYPSNDKDGRNSDNMLTHRCIFDCVYGNSDGSCLETSTSATTNVQDENIALLPFSPALVPYDNKDMAFCQDEQYVQVRDTRGNFYPI